ncbi:uncharacterized protein LOC116667346 [Camelus ferus]|uniref:Uncharacterized protein LOC116667346 n=1 Tax=Camelus ferus TaxID=419612 RepID=A0A8B8U154_CAMFR|nr:uncharacterized protein LOC116667346 [Camelus ferus]
MKDDEAGPSSRKPWNPLRLDVVLLPANERVKPGNEWGRSPWGPDCSKILGCAPASPVLGPFPARPICSPFQKCSPLCILCLPSPQPRPSQGDVGRHVGYKQGVSPPWPPLTVQLLKPSQEPGPSSVDADGPRVGLTTPAHTGLLSPSAPSRAETLWSQRAPEKMGHCACGGQGPAGEPWQHLDPQLQQLLEEKEQALAVLQEMVKVAGHRGHPGSEPLGAHQTPQATGSDMGSAEPHEQPREGSLCPEVKAEQGAPGSSSGVSLQGNLRPPRPILVTRHQPLPVAGIGLQLVSGFQSGHSSFLLL